MAVDSRTARLKKVLWGARVRGAAATHRSVLAILLIVAQLGVLPVFAADQQPANPRANVRSPHGALSRPCEDCHTRTAWTPMRNLPEFNHNDTKYPLRGMHLSVGCKQCHTNMVFTKVGMRCADCHADLHRGQFGANCEQCHTVKGWKVSLNAVKDHFNRFPLIGAHAVVECDACHKSAASGQFQGLSTSCFSCHQADYRTPVINHVGLSFGTNCSDCHSMNSWLGAKFDHLKYTGYALLGMHATLDCSACHAGGHYAGTPANCFGCHQKDFTGTTNPNHVQAGFPHDCGVCHSSVAWSPATFNHSTFTNFPLTGAHVSVPCASCHVNGNYGAIPTDCASCHMGDYNKTTNPNHKSAGFPTTCNTCHNTTSWTNATFDHSKTPFPLTGAHVSVPCASCHVNGNYGAIPTDCASCHMGDYNKTTNPNHKSAGIPTTCNTCHNTSSWTTATFDHSKTAFPLTGAHVTVPCASCHVNGNYGAIPTDCASCHMGDYNKTTSPNHASAGFPTTCNTCHNTSSWATATFDHSKTAFPLTGAHVTVPCSSCHTNGNYTTLPTLCYGCHQKDFTGALTPPHLAGGFPQTCVTCHTTAAWSPATFNHATFANFALTGAHATLTCVQCHVNNNYNLTSTACATCHMTDFNGTTSPNHKTSGFPTDCSICHSTTAWIPATFNHNTTAFPLTGAHVSVACATCHVNNNFTTLPTDCYSCHTANYNGTTNPNHKTVGFPTTCAVCHSTTAWSPATFNHNTTSFPLTGAHVTVACTSCHINGNYTTTPTDCYSCHTADYTGTNNPNHVASAFPTTCATCHTTTSWAGATFNHTWFPIYSGTHAGKWTTCGDCHTNPADYSVFSCITCHQHSQANTDPHHTRNTNYVYSATSCYSCHRNGNGG